MTGQVQDTIKTQRVHRLIDLSNKLHEQYAHRFIGKEVEVIFEEVTKNNNLVCHASNYLKVEAEGEVKFIGEITKVEILSYENGVCKGRIKK